MSFLSLIIILCGMYVHSSPIHGCVLFPTPQSRTPVPYSSQSISPYLDYIHTIRVTFLRRSEWTLPFIYSSDSILDSSSTSVMSIHSADVNDFRTINLVKILLSCTHSPYKLIIASFARKHRERHCRHINII